MAENKKSVLLYCDIIHTVEKLTDDQAGKLFKHYLRYINDLYPKGDDITEIIFESIKQNLKRDLKKWDDIKLKRVESGRKGGLANQANARSAKGIQANQAVTGNVTVTVNVNDINKRKGDFKKSSLRFNDIYSVKTIHDFVDYWTEHNEKGKLMRFEMKKNKPFNMKRRLVTWKKNKDLWDAEKKLGKKEKINAGTLIQKKYGLS